MNLIKRFKAPTPKKYKKCGAITKNMSYALAAGTAALASTPMPTLFTYIVGGLTFVTATISAFCYAQVEVEDDKKEKND